MPRNGSGTFTLVTGNPVVSGTIIESTWANSTLADIADSITNSLARNGEGGMTAALRVLDGNVGAPGLGFVNETSSGFYRAAAGDLGLAVLGSRILRLQATGASLNGSLLIEATGSDHQLTVKNTGTAASDDAILQISTSSTGTTSTISGFYFGDGDSTSVGQIRYNHSDDSMTFWTSGAEEMRLTSAGFLGIRKTPTVSLDVSGSIHADGVIRNTDGGSAASPSIQPGNDADTGMYWVSSNVLGFSTGGTARAVIDASGNIGVGTTTPASYNSAGFGRNIAIANPTSSALTVVNGSRQYQVGVNSANNFLVYDGNAASSRLTIDIAGDAAFFGNIAGGNDITAARYLVATSSGALTTSAPGIWGGFYGGNYGRFNFIKGSASGTGSTPACQFYYGSGTTVGSIGCTSTATAYNTSSDYRLKEDVQPMTGALEKLALVKPVTFKWKVNGEAAQGFIAHELQEVFPDAVTGAKDGVEMIDDYDDEGKSIGQKEVPFYQGVDSSFLVATLVAAIQELKAEVDALKAVSPA